MALTKVTGQVINSTTDLSVGVATVGGGTSTGDLYVVGVTTFSGDVSVGGTLTYEDVTNVDSVGLITARSGISVTGVGVTIALGGLNVNAGISTFNDKVLIGGPTHSRELSVHAATNTTICIEGAANGTSNLMFGDENDEDVGMIQYNHVDNDLAFTVNTAEALAIKSDGQLVSSGTGAELNLTNTGSTATETTGYFYTSQSGIHNVIQIKTSTNNGGDPYIKFDGGGQDMIVGERYAGTTNNLLVLGPGNNPDTTSGIFVKGTGLVGVGTDNPQKDVHIESATPFLRLEETSSSAKRLDLWVESSDGYIGCNQSSQDLHFQTTGTTRLTIKGNTGNLGINETDPDELLHISANNNGVTAVTSANNTLRFTDIDTTVTSNQPGGVIEWETLDSTAAGVNAYIATKNSNTGYASLHFGTGNVTTLEDRLVLGQGGDLTLYGGEGLSANLYLIANQGDDDRDNWRIGSNQDDNDLTIAQKVSGSHVDVITIQNQVGNTTTNALLWGKGVTDGNEAILSVKGSTVGGTDRFAQLMVAKHSNITNLAAAMRWTSDDGTTRYLYMDNSTVVRISGSYNDIGTTSGSVVGSQSSDIRLKNLIGDGSVPYGLSEINQLNPIKFKYKKTGGDPDRIQIGFSAQQVKPIIPEAVYDTGEEVEGEENILAMDYVNIIPALVNSIKELSAENNALKARLDAAGL